MIALLAALLFVGVLFGSAFLVPLLWFIAPALFVVWMLGFLVHPAGGRWFYW